MTLDKHWLLQILRGKIYDTGWNTKFNSDMEVSRL